MLYKLWQYVSQSTLCNVIVIVYSAQKIMIIKKYLQIIKFYIPTKQPITNENKYETIKIQKNTKK